MGLVSSEHREVAAWAGIKTCYAIDLDGGCVTLLRTRRMGKALRSRVVFQGDPAVAVEDWAQTVHNLNAEVASGHAWLVGVLPAHSALVKKVDAPFASQAKALRVFPSLLDIRLPFPLEQCQYTFPEMQQTPDGQVQALAVAARHEEIEAYLEACRALEVEPSLLDHEGLALWALAKGTSKADRDTHRVVAYIGRERTVLVLGQGRELEQVHGLRIGTQALAEKGVAAWVKRIERIWKTLPGAWSEQPVHWTLSGALDATQRAELEGALKSFSQATLVCTEPVLLEQLAARAMKPGALRCNFLAGDHTSTTLRSGLARRNRKTAGFFLACGLVLCALAFSWSQVLHAREQQVQQQVDAAFLALTGMPNQQRGMEPIIAQRVLDEQAQGVEPFHRMFTPSPASLLDAVLRHCATQGIRLQNVSMGTQQIHIEGRAESADELVGLRSILEGQSMQVELTKKPANPYVDFVMDAHTGKEQAHAE